MVKTDYFLLNRRLIESELWLSEPFTRAQAWVDLIGLARFRDGHARIRGIRVEIKRGQVAWSVKGLADRWKWSRGKTDRFLKELENGHQIEQQKNNVTSLISIINYDAYQLNGHQIEHQTGSRRAADGHQTNTRRAADGHKRIKGNKGKEGKEGINTPKPPTGDSFSGRVDEVVAHYQTYHEKARPGDKERRLITARLKDGYSVEDLKKAIDGNHESPFHSGVNENGKKYHGLTLIFRDSDKVNGFIEAADGADVRRGPSMPTLAQVQEAYGHVKE